MRISAITIVKMYYLKLSGLIPEEKQMEFEQTYRFVATQIPRTCTSFSFSRDVLKEDEYYFMSFWSTSEALHTFYQSPVFLMLLGAFNALGKLRENVSGQLSMSLN
jgi:hypothetical protein